MIKAALAIGQPYLGIIMKLNRQRVKFNCFGVAISCILNLEVEDIPDCFDITSWDKPAQLLWLKEKGFGLVEQSIDNIDLQPTPNMLCVLQAQSLHHKDILHAIVGRTKIGNGKHDYFEFWFDPASGVGNSSEWPPKFVTWIIPLFDYVNQIDIIRNTN